MDEYKAARDNMVESQIRPHQVTDSRILRAMGEIPREIFVPASMKGLAYMDEEVPLDLSATGGAGRHLMAPMPLARLIQLAEVADSDLVLDVGCATGYSTTVLARLADSVVGLECDPALAERASQALLRLEVDNAAVLTGPLEAGYPGEGPYDAVVLNGCVPEVPEALLSQLKDGGRLVAILAEDDFGQACVFHRTGARISRWAAFETGGPPLPGFRKTPQFVF